MAADADGNCYLTGTIGPAFMGNGTSIFGTNNVELGIYDYLTWLSANDLYAKAFVAAGQPGQQFILQASTNLVNWSPVSTNTLTPNQLMITNQILPGGLQQFFRTRQFP